MAGGWPEELEHDIFEKIDFEKLLSKLSNYQTMAHSSIRPDYQIVNSQIGRVGHPMEDFKLATTAARLAGLGTVSPFDDEAARLAFVLIQHYGGLKLIKFLFFLPRANDMIRRRLKTIVIEDWIIDVYKGIENILFEIYEGLPEGGQFTDQTVMQKFRSILNNSV